MKKLLFVLLAGALAAAWWALRRETPLPARLAAVERGEVRATVANTRVGTVEACDRARMSPSAAGQVAVLNVHEGDRVAAGTVLLEIWNEDVAAELRLAEAEVGATRLRADEACANADGARREATRLARLRAKRLIAEETVDAAETSAAALAAACAAGRAATGVATARVAVTRAALERTRLVAPFAGIVAEVDARLGEFLTPSPPGIPTVPAVDLIAPDCLYVSAPIDEVDAPRLVTGMSACVSLDAFDDRRCAARVRRIAPYVLEREKQARTVEVEVEFTDEVGRAGLLPGYSADIEILVERRASVLRIPSEAVLEGERVLVYEPASGRLAGRAFRAGLANWEYTEVVDGLAAGERVLVGGGSGLVAGARVTPDDGDGK